MLLDIRSELVEENTMEHFNSILFHKSGPANKQDTYQSILEKLRCTKCNQIGRIKISRIFKNNFSMGKLNDYGFR
jgi:hypothetical protein